MSNTLRTYTQEQEKSNPNRSEKGEVSITAFCGGELGHAVQITINNNQGCMYGHLSAKQVEDLIMILQKRLKCEDGHSATDSDIDAHMGPDGILRDDPIHRAIEEVEL